MKLETLLERDDIAEDAKQLIREGMKESRESKDNILAEQRRLELLLTRGPAVVYVCKAHGDFGATFISGNVERQMGYQVRQFVEDSGFWAGNLHPDERERVLDELKHVFEKDFYTHEYRFLHGDGTYRWMRDECTLIRDDEGNPHEIIGCWVDLTDRKEAEKELRESEERFRTLVEQATDAIFVIDIEGQILDVNRQSCESLGYTREELLAMNVADVDTEVVAGEHRKRFWEGLKPGQPAMLDGMQKRKDGSTFPVEIRLGVLKQEPETTLIGLVRDVTDRKNAEEKNKELAAAEAAAEAEKKSADELRAANQQLRASEQQLKASDQQLRAANQQLKAQEQALRASQQELIGKVSELERFNKLMVGRELQMVDLKKEVDSLLEKQRQPKKYEI